LGLWWAHRHLTASVEELPVARRILIVEDETMIAMMEEDFLKELGWHVVGLAGGTDGALAMARDASIDAALLDVNLSGRDTFAVADILSERHIPFVFATGYGADGVADRFRGVPRLTKPFQRDELGHALEQAMASARAPLEGRFADPGSRASPGKSSSPGC
jgi:CheY-like chemotaxis protein